jgi:hypothetical protein
MRDFLAKSKDNFKKSSCDAEGARATSMRTTTYGLEKFFLATAIRAHAMFHQRPQALHVQDLVKATRSRCSIR